MSLLVGQLRTLLGKQDTRIVGEIVVLKNAAEPRYVLRAHASGGDVWVESEEGTNVGELVSTIAERLVQRFDPLVAAFYYLRTPKPDHSNLTEAIGFADGFHSRDKRQQSWALVLRGLAWREKGNPEETRASLCAAIDLDESFIPAWRILASSLREDGAVDQAVYLARRLVRTQPNEPEGYRELGALRANCMGGDGERTKAIGYFKRALDLGSRQRAPDYLSRVDYARFLYTWYQPVFSPRPKDFVNYMDLAAHTYLEEAEALAPDEPSVYTTLARILSHPQDEVLSGPEPKPSENEIKTRHAAAESRLLEAELKARYAYVRDSTSPEANLALGEVLTDQSAELRNHLLQTSDSDDIPDEPTAHSKSTQAKEYLELARKSSEASGSIYDAIYARALAGAGEFAEAEKVLDEADMDDDPHVVEWVRGEMRYNQKRYAEALEHLKAAQAVRICGPRSNLVHNLIIAIEARLATEHRAASAHPATHADNKALASASAAQTQAKSLYAAKPACPKWTEPENEEPSP
ncbi:MAG: hypothetical protein JOZ16_11615 [Methylobacteriaceae bacterium]|nr:hypothetical protein [Methylobacteriaceae bacterium]